MPIDNVTWRNCRQCGHRFATHITRCPRCGTAAKNIPLILGITLGAAGAVIALAMFLIIPHLGIINEAAKTAANQIGQVPQSVSVLLNTAEFQDRTKSQSRGTSSITSTDASTNQGNPPGVYSTSKRMTILNERFVLGAKSYRDIPISIPAAKSADISGKMFVDGDSYIRLLLLDQNGKARCDDSSPYCFDDMVWSKDNPIKDTQFGEATIHLAQTYDERVEIRNLPVDTQRTIRIDNRHSLTDQTVQVVLELVYVPEGNSQSVQTSLSNGSSAAGNSQKVSQQILTEQLTLLTKDIRELSTTIPNQKVDFLDARIVPDKGTSVQVKFYKNNGQYCDSGGKCSFVVMGGSSTESLQTQKIKIPVLSGDAIKVVIFSGDHTGVSQIVSVVLSVQY